MLVEFSLSRFEFTTKLVEFFTCCRIEQIPLFHVPQICHAESFGFRKCGLEVETDLLDYS